MSGENRKRARSADDVSRSVVFAAGDYMVKIDRRRRRLRRALDVGRRRRGVSLRVHGRAGHAGQHAVVLGVHQVRVMYQFAGAAQILSASAIANRRFASLATTATALPNLRRVTWM